MKRLFILFVAVMFALSAAVAVADEAILIDFNKLAADAQPEDDPANPQKKVNTQNTYTMMDFSQLSGQGFTPEQKAAMKTSLAIRNWEVVLASSSRNVTNQLYSLTKEAKVKDSDGITQYKGQTMMGVRVHFPTEPFNSWAKIKPPFQIPAFEAKDPNAEGGADGLTRFEGSKKGDVQYAYGVVKNVGVIKKLGVNVKGLNFPHSLSVVVTDDDNNETVMMVGYLNFNGWKTLEWENPAYVKEVRNRELRVFPLYPKSSPYVKFDSFLIQRDAAAEGGDFVAYIKDVKIIYDKAVLDPLRDIDDEEVWGIIETRENQRKKIESRRFGQLQVLRYLEGQKQEKKDKFTPSDGQSDQQ